MKNYSTWGNGAFDGWLITKEEQWCPFLSYRKNMEAGFWDLVGVVIIGGAALLVSLLTSSS